MSVISLSPGVQSAAPVVPPVESASVDASLSVTPGSLAPPGDAPVPVTLSKVFKTAQLYAGSSPEDLACALDTHDFPTGSSTGVRNTITVDDFKMLVGLDPDESMGADDLVASCAGRPWLLVVPAVGADDAPVMLLRPASGDAPGFVRVLPDGTEQPGDSAFFAGLSGSDRLVFANRSVVDDGVSVYVGSEATGCGPGTGGRFYHEKQDAGQCGIHSANAFFGKRAVLPSGLTTFNAETYSSGAGAAVRRFPSEYRDSAPDRVIDATIGNNPYTLMSYMRSLAAVGQVEPRYGCLALEQVRHDGASSAAAQRLRALPEGVDRLVLGQTKPVAHFIAFRADESGRWFRIDSLDPEQAVVSPADYVAGLPAQDLYLVVESGPAVAGADRA